MLINAVDQPSLCSWAVMNLRNWSSTSGMGKYMLCRCPWVVSSVSPGWFNVWAVNKFHCTCMKKTNGEKKYLFLFLFVFFMQMKNHGCKKTWTEINILWLNILDEIVYLHTCKCMEIWYFNTFKCIKIWCPKISHLFWFFTFYSFECFPFFKGGVLLFFREFTGKWQNWMVRDAC